MSGYTTSGLPAAVLPFTGLEQAAFDTQLSAGRSPESSAITTSLLASYILANGGVTTSRGGSASATAGAATLNSGLGKVTSESITTAAGSDYILTLTNNQIIIGSNIQVSVSNGTNTTEGIAVNRVQSSTGGALIHIRNTNASVALNGTITINFVIFN